VDSFAFPFSPSLLSRAVEVLSVFLELDSLSLIFGAVEVLSEFLELDSLLLIFGAVEVLSIFLELDSIRGSDLFSSDERSIIKVGADDCRQDKIVNTITTVSIFA
jgi:hypothetical protein